MERLNSGKHKLSRIGWIDSLKGICMITIIMIHIPGEPEVVARFTYPFMLVGFFFVAGVTFSLKRDFGSFLKAKFMRLVFPVFAFGILNTILSISFKDVDLMERLKGVFLQIPGQWDDMWFVACLFVMELIYYPVERYIDRLWIKIMVSLFACCAGIIWIILFDMPLPWHIINAMLFLPFLMAGKILSTTGRLSIYAQKTRDNIMLALIPIVLYCASVLLVRNWPVDMHMLKFGNPFLFTLSAVTGLLSVCSISIVLDKYKFSAVNSILYFIGANTLVFYGLQSKAISLFDAIFNRFSSIFPTDIIWILVFLSVVPVLAVASVIINRWFPFMTGNFKFIKR